MPFLPKAGEDQQTFVSRCIKHEMDTGKAKDTKQAAAICYSKWRNRNKK